MQKVEILKALIRGAKVLILDEPTAVLTPQETKELFEQLHLLKKNGHSIIFISHKLEEVMELCDNVTVLRHGRCNGTHSIKDLNEAKISRLMVGRDVVLKIDKDAPKTGKNVLEIKNLKKISETGRTVLDDVSFTIREGEIVGIAGVEGNGQSMLSDCISGMMAYDEGSIKLNGKEVNGQKIKDIREGGMSVIPEDRMTVGCVDQMSITDNIMADRFAKPENMKGPFMDAKKADEITEKLIKEFEIACDDKSDAIRFLSGGNIQKVVVAREFTAGANFVLANQPTRGVDVGTAELIRKYLVRQSRENNIGSLLISANLNEVLEVSDRLLVMRKGKIVAALQLGELVMALGVSSDTNYAQQYQLQGNYAATASFDLLREAVASAEKAEVPFKVGNVFSTDVFYRKKGAADNWQQMGILAAEMESFALYCNAAYAGVNALSILTVSDLLSSGQSMTTEEREKGFKNMMEVALNVAWTTALDK